MFFHMAEYCDTPQSKERRNREYKVCLNERAILRLLDPVFQFKITVSTLATRMQRKKDAVLTYLSLFSTSFANENMRDAIAWSYNASGGSSAALG